MTKYIDAEKLYEKVDALMAHYSKVENEMKDDSELSIFYQGKMKMCSEVLDIINSLPQEQPDMVQWTGNNLKEVIDFTGKSPRFEEWFKSWEEFETYVHQHNDILKLFCEDGSHYEIPVGSWIVKTPDGYNLPSVAKYIQQEQPEVDLEKEFKKWWDSVASGKVNVDHSAYWYMEKCAEHFYELGLNARKEE